MIHAKAPDLFFCRSFACYFYCSAGSATAAEWRNPWPEMQQDMSGYLESGRLAAFRRGAVGEVQLTLELQAHQDKRPVRDYASALLAVILTGNGGVIGRIGGGGALIHREKGTWHPVQWPRQDGEANKARWLTDAAAFAAFQIAEISCTPRRISLFSGALERTLTRDASQVTGSFIIAVEIMA